MNNQTWRPGSMLMWDGGKMESKLRKRQRFDYILTLGVVVGMLVSVEESRAFLLCSCLALFWTTSWVAGRMFGKVDTLFGYGTFGVGRQSHDRSSNQKHPQATSRTRLAYRGWGSVGRGGSVGRE